jgi:hypothetical protein
MCLDSSALKSSYIAFPRCTWGCMCALQGHASAAWPYGGNVNFLLDALVRVEMQGHCQKIRDSLSPLGMQALHDPISRYRILSLSSAWTRDLALNLTRRILNESFCGDYHDYLAALDTYSMK